MDFCHSRHFPRYLVCSVDSAYLSGGLIGIVKGLPEAMEHPFSMELCKDSAKTVLLFLLAYGLGIGIYLSTRRKYRREKNMVPLCGETSGNQPEIQ